MGNVEGDGRTNLNGDPTSKTSTRTNDSEIIAGNQETGVVTMRGSREAIAVDENRKNRHSGRGDRRRGAARQHASFDVRQLRAKARKRTKTRTVAVTNAPSSGPGGGVQIRVLVLVLDLAYEVPAGSAVGDVVASRAAFVLSGMKLADDVSFHWGQTPIYPVGMWWVHCGF